MVQDLYNLIILSGTSNSNLVYSEVHTLRSNYFLRFDNLLYSTDDYGKNEVLFVKIAATITKIPSVPKNSGLSQIQLCCPEVPISEILSRIFKISLICPEPLYKCSYTVHHQISALRKTKTSVLFVALLAEYHQYLVTGHI